MNSNTDDHAEYYIHHDVLDMRFTRYGSGYLHKNDDCLTEITDTAFHAIKRELLCHGKVRNRQHNEDYAAIIVKALIMTEDKDTIYLVDESINSDKEKVSLLGGHVEPNDFIDMADTPIQLYFKAELVREMCEELTECGYSNYMYMEDEERYDVVGMMSSLGLDVVEDNTWYCHYTDTAFFVYIPYIVKGWNNDSLNGALIEYPWTQHHSMSSLLADGRHGRWTAGRLYDIGKNDIRMTRHDLLDAIFNTLRKK